MQKLHFLLAKKTKNHGCGLEVLSHAAGILGGSLLPLGSCPERRMRLPANPSSREQMVLHNFKHFQSLSDFHPKVQVSHHIFIYIYIFIYFRFFLKNNSIFLVDFVWRNISRLSLSTPGTIALGGFIIGCLKIVAVRMSRWGAVERWIWPKWVLQAVGGT